MLQHSHNNNNNHGSAYNNRSHNQSSTALGGGTGDRSLHYIKSSKISKADFRELFDFEDNDRDGANIDKDYRKIEKYVKKNTDSSSVKFKHLIGESRKLHIFLFRKIN